MITSREIGSAIVAAMLPVHRMQCRKPLSSTPVTAPSTHRAQYGPVCNGMHRVSEVFEVRPVRRRRVGAVVAVLLAE